MFQARYLPYGEELWREGSSRTDFGFTGQRREVGFGLYDYNARYYSPYLGRFVSPDTIVPDYTNPQSLNRYSYVLGNPLRFTDPSGHCIPGLCPGQNIDYYENLMSSSTGVERYKAAVALNAALANAPDREPWNTDSLRAAIAHDAHLVATKEGLYADQSSYWANFLEDAATAAIPMAANVRGDNYVPSSTIDAFAIVPYRPSNKKSHNLENHHGIMDAWAKHNIPGYVSRKGDAPTIALTETQHKAATTEFWAWNRENGYGKGPDWSKITPREIFNLSERMFDAAEVPTEARQDYYRAFNQYIYTGSWSLE